MQARRNIKSTPEWQVAMNALDSVSSHISVLDPTGRIAHVNKAWSDFANQNKLKGKSPIRTGVGTNYLEVLRNSKGKNAEEALPALAGIQEVMKGRKKRFSLEYPCHSKTEKRWFTMTALPLARGKETWVVITHHNITHTKLLELARHKHLEVQKKYSTELEQTVSDRTEQLRKALSKERKLRQFKTQFIVNASHEFRTPLTIIKLALASIKRFQAGADKVELEEKFSSIDHQIKQITFILDEMLMNGKTNVGAKVSLSTLELNSFLTATAKQVENEWKTHTIVTQFDSIPESITTDETLLKKILINLLHNAIKFSSAQSEILFKAHVKDSKLVLEITDYGIGIPKASQALIFKPFYKGTNAQDIQGVGLGLSIVRNAVQLLGGKIRFESKKDKGTTFQITLPIVKSTSRTKD